jgi:DNA-binding transcriptional ArsR family regulator
LANGYIMASMTESEILLALKNNEPFKGLSNICLANLVAQPEAKQGRFDAKFDLQFGGTKVEVYAEVKSACTPKQVGQIAPWLSQMKAMKKGTAFALVCPALSPRSQKLCFERNVDFIDLAGNVFINIPGKLLLERVGMEPREQTSPSYYRNPFSGKSSRILRVLLQKPRAWTLSEIAEELAKETRRAECAGVSFEVSFSQASRVLRSLEEELLVRRRPTLFDLDQAVSEESLDEVPLVARRNPVVVPEPRRLLTVWAEEYKDRYRRYLRRSFKVPNPFGSSLKAVRQALDGLLKPRSYAFTGAAAASLTAPFVDVDPIDLFISDEAGAENLRKFASGTSIGPDLRAIYPFDAGVFMYSSLQDGIPVVSDIQAYLDLFARGGRDLKQADHLLQTRIEPTWGNK